MLPENEHDFAAAMDRIQAKLTEDEQEILAIAFSGAQVHRTVGYMVLCFFLGLLAGAAGWGLVGT